MSDEAFTMQESGFVNCEITGQSVPKEEIIEIQGYKVSAEGKEELLRSLRSGAVLPGELETPTISRRAVCYLVDTGIVGIIFVLIGFAVMGTSYWADGFMPEMEQSEAGAEMLKMQGLINFVIIGFSLCYFTFFHGIKGQTLGKMAGKVKVVNIDGSKIDIKKAFIRAIFYNGPQVIVPVVYFLNYENSTTLMVMGAATVLTSIWGITDVVMALIDRDQQKSLHDRLAKTRVVMAH